jgi:hypothetical protein
MNNFVSVFEELSKLYEEDTQKVVEKETDKLCSVDFDGQQMFTGTREECEDWIEKHPDPKGKNSGRMTIKDTAKINVVEALTEEADEDIVDEVDEAEEVAAEETPKQLVLECSKCGAISVKAEEEVVIDEATDLANVEDECAACEEAAGYKVLGELLPYAAEEVAEEPAAEEESEPEVTEALLESALTEGKLLDNVKKVATRVGADAATIVRCFTELGEMIANTGNKGEYKTTKLNDFMEYVENKAVFKALMNGNESVMNGTTKEDLEELAQDIEDYKKANKGEGEDLEELLDANVNLSLDGGEGNDVDVL